MEWTIRSGITRATVLTFSAKHCRAGTAFLVHTSRPVRGDATFYPTTSPLFLSTPVASAFVNEYLTPEEAIDTFLVQDSNLSIPS